MHTMSSKSQYERNSTTHAGVDRGTPFDDPTDVLLSMQDIVGRKWNPVILYALSSEGAMGFSALKGHAKGISSKMLSESLDSLTASGLVTREIVSEQPFRVEYSLTETGESLGQLVADLVQWGGDNAAVLGDGADASSDQGEMSPDRRRSQPASWEGKR